MTITRLESCQNSEWGKVVILYREKECKFPVYFPTHEIFNDDPSLLVSYKCTALVFATPFISILRSVYLVATSIFKLISNIYNFLDGQSLSKDTWLGIKGNVSESIRALWYGVLLTRCALIGILSPYWGRQRYGYLERELNRHLDGPHHNKFYLAICFQRLAILSDNPHDTQIAEKLSKYLTRLDTIRNAFWTCSFQQLMKEIRMLSG